MTKKRCEHPEKDQVYLKNGSVICSRCGKTRSKETGNDLPMGKTDGISTGSPCHSGRLE